jgi:hypothetical protein
LNNIDILLSVVHVALLGYGIILTIKKKSRSLFLFTTFLFFSVLYDLFLVIIPPIILESSQNKSLFISILSYLFVIDDLLFLFTFIILIYIIQKKKF